MSALDGWVHVTHPGTGGDALIPDDEHVRAMYEARGWKVSPEIPAHLDPDAPDAATPAAPPATDPAAEPAPADPEQPAAKPAKNKPTTAGQADNEQGE